ncbi:FAD-linked oxidase [Streptomyces eurocidicus]|uniref:FAD-linked oxidase n=1 Tax=Streptomyces eurocidicus TaxID=66423 RepID=A0A2N8NMU9_STREU|nr:FAD-linked oxidase C-terminal domain-containing protein [Streptomyces eurocidicus]MBB5118277.1 glycolate oxidase [Streptomyces eurocidicus]MBF6054652.1 FAD-binding protein [Streptomyces eurocidicus]PNE30095.1 FAD-linked oxidase [Streptomyces eurocidicus]
MTVSVEKPLLAALREALPDVAVLTADDQLDLHSRDAAPFGEAGRPVAVVRPETVEQVREVIRAARAYGVPVVPQGARTGLAGAADAVDGCLVLSMVRMDRILEIDPANRLVRCEPGVVTADLAAAVAERGLCYPPDPASWEVCTIGGNIATGAGGLCCVKYGVTADYVLGLTVVLADGEVLRVGRRTVKGVAGYDLTRLFVGSEGTLGVIVEATLALRPPRPPARALLARFPSASAAGEAVSAIVRAGHVPSALELLDRTTTEAISALGHPLFADGGAATLIVASDAPDAAEDVRAMAALCRDAEALSVTAAAGEAESAGVLEARRMVLPALKARAAALPGEVTAFIEDVAVPRDRLAELIDRIELIAGEYDLYISTVGHAGDGNLHPTVVFDRSDPDAVRRAKEAYDAIMAAGLELGGTITGEHGVGTLKRDWLARELPPRGLRLQRDLKRLFDPEGLLNPGKVLA